ncbi:MAG: hypothetical protein R3F17_03585 [Planctomycetota bacterium]
MQVLPAVHQAQVVDCESGALEQTAQRVGGEVRAVLVVHVPEGPLAQDAQGIGQFEEGEGAWVAAQVFAHAMRLARHLGQVFEGVAADERADGLIEELRSVLLVAEAQASAGVEVHAARGTARIHADASGAARRAQGRKEVAAPRADLGTGRCSPARCGASRATVSPRNVRKVPEYPWVSS